MEAFRLAALPAELQWRLPPEQWAAEADGSLSILAPPGTDLFADPGNGTRTDSAPAALLVPPDESFLLSARVEVTFGATFDAGALHAWVDGDLWAKLCFELSPQREPTIVSVVNRGVSDDCNSVTVSGTSAFLRVAHLGRATAFHWSSDGKHWSLVRYFTLGRTAGLRVGFSSQSPTGTGCRSRFSQIRYRSGALRDLRNGE
jgi:regulation of enolase protein 1 (concanavalin A-like superfamily)